MSVKQKGQETGQQTTGEHGARHQQLSQELIEQIKREMGVKNPAAVVLYDRDEVDSRRSKAQPIIGYPPDVDACECAEVKDVEPFQHEAGATCCLRNGQWRRGVYIGPICLTYGPC